MQILSVRFPSPANLGVVPFFRLPALIAVLFALIPLGALGQASPAQPPTGAQSAPSAFNWGRDPRAITAIQNAITALGGATAIGQAQSWQVQAQVQHVANKFVPAGQQAAVSGVAASTVTWEAAGSEVRATTTGPSGTWVFVTGHGKPALVQSGNTRSLNVADVHQMLVPVLVGPMLLQALQDTTRAILYAGSPTMNGKPVTIVKTRATSGSNISASEQTWFFDQKSSLPIRLQYKITAESAYPIQNSGILDFSQYSSLNGVLYPSSVTRSRGLGPTYRITLQSVETNVPVQSSDFNPASGGTQ